MSESKHYSDGMRTELLMRNVFGDKYYGLASAYQNPKYFKQDVKILLKKLRQDVDDLIANDHFKGACRLYLESIEKELGNAKSEDDYRKLFVNALDIVTILLGYHFEAGNKRTIPFYIPNIWNESQGWSDALKFYEYQDSLFEKRKSLVAQLKNEGFTNAAITEIMNISTYKLAQILIKIKTEEESNE